MDVTVDFECGAGKRLQRVAPQHWRLEAMGDPSGYDKYFCVRIASAADEPPATLRLDIYPDADLGEKGAAFFHSHFPSHLWCCAGTWTHWYPLRNRWEDAVTFRDDRIEVELPVTPGTELFIATNAPLRYSDLLLWLAALRADQGDRVQVGSLGRSAEGRDIPVVRIAGTRPGLPRLLVLAGQHPSEHCGNWAGKGIVEYALSSIATARALRDTVELAVVPMLNPDGNVHGLSGATAEGVNLFSDFRGVAAGTPAKATESRALWAWLQTEFTPDVLLHFHGYMGWKQFSQPPYDGIYLLQDPDKVYPSAARRAAYRAIQDRLSFETPGHTATWSPGILGEESVDYQLATAFGTLSAFYEINSGSVGPFEQYRRGPEVLSAVVRALAHDVAPEQ